MYFSFFLKLPERTILMNDNLNYGDTFILGKQYMKRVLPI